jgi:hypothetical protein
MPNEETPVGNLQVFPQDNPWNKDISNEPADPNSDNLIASIGNDIHLHPDFGTVWENAPIGIPFNVVGSNQTMLPVTFQYPSESDPGPYPIPPDALIESGSDRHILIVDTTNQILYELFNAVRNNNGWQAGSGTRNAFIHPATHAASDHAGENFPPMGMRVRLKAGFDINGFSSHVQVILRALKKYGMFVADNGSNWYISGAPDSRWDDEELGELKTIAGRNFEVVKMENVIPMPD